MRLVLGLSEGVHCVVWRDERGERLLQLVYSLLPPLLYMTISEHVSFILPSSVRCCVRVFFRMRSHLRLFFPEVNELTLALTYCTPFALLPLAVHCSSWSSVRRPGARSPCWLEESAPRARLASWCCSCPMVVLIAKTRTCLLYTSPSPRDATLSRMPSSA